MKILKIFLVFLLMSGKALSAQEIDVFFNKADAFFKTYITNGKVEYRALHEQPAILKELMLLTEKTSISGVDENTYQAFWINAYNLTVINGVVENYPLKSPLDIDGFFDKIQHKIAGQKVTLNQIENQLLHDKFPNEPRYHFVLVCAGMGCPPIIKEAYRPNTLNAQLERQTKKAVNDPNFIRVHQEEVKISQIFEWYKNDFEPAGGIVKFINQYRTEKLPADAKLEFYPYDWTLNSVH
ncbi:MAG: DUF547 domain-containing protein [Maribacter sp.]